MDHICSYLTVFNDMHGSVVPLALHNDTRA